MEITGVLKLIFSKYIGIKKGTLDKFQDRIEFVKGDAEISDGVWLIPHKTADLHKAGKKAGMYKRVNKKWVPDNFDHEQSLVIDTEKGLVIFNSCCHGGADNIIKEVAGTQLDKELVDIFLTIPKEKLVQCMPEEVSY